MALRITVPPAALERRPRQPVGLRRGRPRSPPAPPRRSSPSLLDAHHYTDGLEFLPPRHTHQQYRRPSRRRHPGRSRARAQLRHRGRLRPGDARRAVQRDPRRHRARTPRRCDRAGARATSARPASSHELDMRSMNVALWQVGWGYYLSNMVGFDGTGLTPRSWSLGARSFRHSRAQRRAVSDPALRPPALRRAAGDLARSVASRRPARSRLSRPTPGCAIFCSSCAITSGARASPTSFRIGPPAIAVRSRCRSRRHHAHGCARQRLQRARPCSAATICSTCAPSSARTCRPPASLRRTMRWRPACCSGSASRGVRVFRALSAAEAAWAITAPLVQDGEVSPWRGLEPNYIKTLLEQRSIATLTQTRPDPASPTATASLLQLLCAMRSCASWPTPRRISWPAAPQGADPVPLLRDAELIDLVTDQAPPAPPPPWTRRLDQPAPGIAGGLTMRQYLEGLASVRHAGHGGARRFPPQPHLAQGPRQRDAAVSDAGHARPLVASARCVDHVIRHQAPRHHDGRRPARRLCGCLWMGREAQAHAGLVRDGGDDTAGRRGGPAGHAQHRPRLHPRALHDPCGGRRVAAQRASRRQRHAGVRQPVCHRSVIAPRARSGAAARRPAPGPAAGRAARLPPRARPARHSSSTSRSPACAGWRPWRRARSTTAAAPPRRSPPTTWWTGSRSPACGRATSRQSSRRRSPRTRRRCRTRRHSRPTRSTS